MSDGNPIVSDCGGGCIDARSTAILVIEPFFGGSHKQLIETLMKHSVFGVVDDVTLCTLADKKWKWRLRSSSFHFASTIPTRPSTDCYDVLFCSSMLNLPDLLAMRQDLQRIKRKIVYFHENQLEYPNQVEKQRDVQFGLMQLSTALSADLVAWNSEYNMRSFLHGLPKLFRMVPRDQRPDVSTFVDGISSKSHVLYYPVDVPPSQKRPVGGGGASSLPACGPLRIVWNHRWEWDKGPDVIARVLCRLVDASIPFEIALIGQTFGSVPEAFEQCKSKLEPHIHAWGYLPQRREYWECLHWADVCVSTARHEFFGVSIVEALMAGCYPLCPDELVYPDYLDSDHLYRTEAQLFKKLKQYARRPDGFRNEKRGEALGDVAERFTMKRLKSEYIKAIYG